LKSRVIFSISPTADAADTPPTGDLSVSLLPADIHVASLPAGKSVRLETLTEPLTLTNTSAHRVSVELRALTCESAGSALHANEAEMLKAADVRIQPGTLTLEPGERRTVTGTITRGSAKASRGKDLVCVISAAVTGEPVQTRIYSRLYAPVR